MLLNIFISKCAAVYCILNHSYPFIQGFLCLVCVQSNLVYECVIIAFSNLALLLSLRLLQMKQTNKLSKPFQISNPNRRRLF